MGRRRWGGALAAVAAGAALVGCSSGHPEVAEGAGPELYREQVRAIEPFNEMDDADLDSIAASACDIVEAARDRGESDVVAMDAVLEVITEFTATDADALVVSLSIVGNHCPLDLSELQDS